MLCEFSRACSSQWLYYISATMPMSYLSLCVCLWTSNGFQSILEKKRLLKKKKMPENFDIIDVHWSSDLFII